jgi:hypothetical protein
MADKRHIFVDTKEGNRDRPFVNTGKAFTNCYQFGIFLLFYGDPGYDLPPSYSDDPDMADLCLGDILQAWS